MFPSHAESLPESLFSAEAVQAMDRYLIGDCGVDGYGLMRRAARSAFRQLLRWWPEPGRLVVACGAGNNGGDGYLVAVNALRHGLDVRCVAVTEPGSLQGDAGRACSEAREAGVPIISWSDLAEQAGGDVFASADLIVDALLGTGTRGAPRAPFNEVIRAVNQAGCPVLAVDLPSGLDGSTGHCPADVIEASATVTFIGMKVGLVTGRGPAVVGELMFDDLGESDALASSGQEPDALLAQWPGVAVQCLPRRSPAAHKGRFGHVLVVAGDRGFGGAGLLAAEAASRSGAGLVTLATRPEHVAPMLARCPSVMVRGLTHGNELAPLLSAADVIVCGPGLGQQAWGQQMLQQVQGCGIPRLLDADALNLMARRVPVVSEHQLMTPHPGEAARLLGCTVAEVEQDRLTAARRLQETWGGVVLLKGAGTVICSGQGLPVVVAGANPGLATGGMGDVLAGVSGALMGQMTDLKQAAVVAAAAHLQAGHLAAGARGFMGLLPADVVDALSGVFAAAERRQAMTFVPARVAATAGVRGDIKSESAVHD